MCLSILRQISVCFLMNSLLLPTATELNAKAKLVELPARLEPVIEELFGTTEGAIVIYDLKQQRYARYHPERCKRRFAPCSTFKIPNSLIALETGVIPDTSFMIPWDSVKVPRQAWWQTARLDWGRDHNLRSAIQNSVVWFYQEVARRIGSVRMQNYLNRIDYGNEDISGGIDRFWLVSSLQISAEEQIEFLKKFYTGQLGFSERTTAIVKSILLIEKTPMYSLHAKTGGGNLGDNKALGWYVGFVEQPDNVFLFALNIEGENFLEIREKRIELTRQILKALEII